MSQAELSSLSSPITAPSAPPPPALSATWSDLRSPESWPSLAAALLVYVPPRRWYRAKGRRPLIARVLDVVSIDGGVGVEAATLLALVEITSAAHGGAGNVREVYVVPLARVDGTRADSQLRDQPQAIVAVARDGLVVDGLATGAAAQPLLMLMREGGVALGARGELRGQPSPELASLSDGEVLPVDVPRVEQTNSIATFGERVLLKIYRQAGAGASPELEVGRFLAEHCEPPCSPRVMGALIYHGHGAAGDGSAARVIGIAHEYLANDGDAWSLAQRELQAYFARVMASAPADPAALRRADPEAPWVARTENTDAAEVPIGAFETVAETLGRRTGQLHLALAGMGRDGHAVAGTRAGDDAGADFGAEPLSASDRAGQAARVATLLDDNLAALAAALDDLSPAARALAAPLLSQDATRRAAALVLARWRVEPLTLVKTRTHGDLHLGQVLVLGDDVAIIDFEGEPARPLAERRGKSSPVRDVMGMVRSFDYAPAAALRAHAAAGDKDDGDDGAIHERLTAAGARWTRVVTERYLAAYRATVGSASIIPRSPAQQALLFTFFELEKVIYELGYELDNRPDWVEIPLRGLTRILGAAGGPAAGPSAGTEGAEPRG